MLNELLFFLMEAVRNLKTEGEWQEILVKIKEEEEESLVPTNLFKV